MPISKERKAELKTKLVSDLDMTIAAIQARMEARTKQYEYEQSRDAEKLDFLLLQNESVKGIK